MSPYRTRDLETDEISSVVKGSARGAKVLLLKSPLRRHSRNGGSTHSYSVVGREPESDQGCHVRIKWRSRS